MPTRDDRDADDDEKTGVERWVLPYFEEPGLWPVLFVVMAAAAAFMTPALLLAARDRDLRGIAATGLLAFGSVRAVTWEWKQRGRPGALSGAIAGVWTLAIAAAFYGARHGML